jgi:hypothetical protein
MRALEERGARADIADIADIKVNRPKPRQQADGKRGSNRLRGIGGQPTRCQ